MTGFPIAIVIQWATLSIRRKLIQHQMFATSHVFLSPRMFQRPFRGDSDGPKSKSLCDPFLAPAMVLLRLPFSRSWPSLHFLNSVSRGFGTLSPPSHPDGGSILPTTLSFRSNSVRVFGVLGRMMPVNRLAERRSDLRTSHCLFLAR